MRMNKLVILVIVVLLFIPLLAHYYLNKVGGDESQEEEEASQWAARLVDVDRLRGAELKSRIEEMLRIKASVATELRELEGRRQKVQTDIGVLTRKLDDGKIEASRKRNELDRLQMSLTQAKVAEKEAMERNTPRLGRPKALQPLWELPKLTFPNGSCSFDTCVDFSFCPLAGKFGFFLYPLSKSDEGNSEMIKLYHALTLDSHVTRNPKRACLFILLLFGSSFDYKTLPHWNGDGRNHAIWILENEKIIGETGRAFIVSTLAEFGNFRPGFDIVTSHLGGTGGWADLPQLVPAKRKYLASYLGEARGGWLEGELLKTQQEDPLSFVFQFSCTPAAGRQGSRNLCENDLLRTRLLLDSTFSIILLRPDDPKLRSSEAIQKRLYESVKYGAIPVVLGLDFEAPWSEVIDWNRIMFNLPSARVSELHYFLKSITDDELLAMRRRGRLAFLNYLATTERVAETLLALIRTRLLIPPSPYKDSLSPSPFNRSFTPLRLEVTPAEGEEEENLGPIEPPYPSPAFVKNLTFNFLQRYESWNTYFTPFRLFPFNPWEEAMPSEAKFRGSSVGFRPIGLGAGGAGKEFSESLGGNLPKEQFTVVMLTYEREAVLINSLQRLYALPYLNKVVVVWNSPNPPPPELKWPEIGVPLHIIKAEKNSLNNRFLPFDVIETEAVLSIDDDAHLRHDEIVFGFRVWRENRDRIVGFPGRFHAWDLNFGGWHYNSNYSCELSMVLTGAAFFHKVYSYLYTYEMPSAIRDKVDELMNCEDIAMNFLISHVTQKPPVKVTSRWTFRCPGCPVTLSEDESHFEERHHCINFFSKVYGYTPLLSTQFRADSILFKTRIPHDKQKCFKYI